MQAVCHRTAAIIIAHYLTILIRLDTNSMSLSIDPFSSEDFIILVCVEALPVSLSVLEIALK